MAPRPKMQIPVWRACEQCRTNRRKCSHKYAVLLARKIDGPDATPQPLQDESLIAYAADPSSTRKVRKKQNALAMPDFEEDNIKVEDEGHEPRVYESVQSPFEAPPPRAYPPSPSITAYPSIQVERGYINGHGSPQVESLPAPPAPYLPIRPAERKYTPVMPTVQRHCHAHYQQHIMTPAPSRFSPVPPVQYRQNTKYGPDPRSRWTNPAKASISRFSGPKKVTPLTVTRR